MPQFTDLSPDEVKDITERKVRVDLDTYLSTIESIMQQPELVGAIMKLEPGESMPVAKRRLTRAANAAQKQLKYKKIKDDELMFTVLDKIRGE